MPPGVAEDELVRIRDPDIAATAASWRRVCPSSLTGSPGASSRQSTPTAPVRRFDRTTWSARSATPRSGATARLIAVGGFGLAVKLPADAGLL
jgi:hypothetical protein